MFVCFVSFSTTDTSRSGHDTRIVVVTTTGTPDTRTIIVSTTNVVAEVDVKKSKIYINRITYFTRM